MPALIGTYEYSLDPKNRVFVPPRYRDQLAAEQGRHFILSMGFDRCLYLFLPSQWERILTDNKGDLTLRDKHGQRALKRFLFSNAMEAPPDDQGRILISQRFKQHAGLKKEVVILGSGTKAEIWDKKAHAGQNASAQRLFRRLSDKLDL